MIENSNNKMIASAPSSKLALREYHFAGEGVYHPQTVLASSLEGATEMHIKTRRPYVVPVKVVETEGATPAEINNK